MNGPPLHPTISSDSPISGDTIADRTVAELVADDYRRAEVFKRYGIDFCCGGGRTVEAVCRKKNVSFEELSRALTDVTNEKGSSPLAEAKSWDLGFLADYIVNVHHRYVRENIPLLIEFTAKVARVHGHADAELIRIAEIFGDVAAELNQHMMKEEQILFPYIKQLEQQRRQGGPTEAPPFGTVQNPISMMEHEHEQVGAWLHEIQELSHDYMPPEHACNTYRVSFLKLKEFEEDLHTHIHLENNILFPRAIELESRG